MKINELRVGMNFEELTAKVKEIEETKEVTTKFGTQITLTVAILEDETGTVKLNMWGEQSNGIEEGATVEVKKGFVKDFRGDNQISIGKQGSIKVV